jgi:hypothetical protein
MQNHFDLGSADPSSTRKRQTAPGCRVRVSLWKLGLSVRGRVDLHILRFIEILFSLLLILHLFPAHPI